MSKTHRSQTFRVFVSSTFADFEPERNALQDRVFPSLRAYCEERGFRFEPIDLRWGVNEEAGLDQQTMKICLGELVNCQRISPRPNFIILAGNRYGWRPLPFEIEADEFEQLMRFLPRNEQARLRFDESQSQVVQGEGNGWYRRDDNSVPPSYVLLPRYAGSKFADQERWQQEETALHKILRSAAAKVFPNSADGKRAKYFHSATHEEIQAGLFANPEAKDHVFAYLRECETESVLIGDQQDSSSSMIQVLKDKIASCLDDDHIYRYPETSHDSNTEQIQAFCERVGDDLKRIISEEITYHESISEHESENELHHTFAKERSSHFVGREEPLKAITDYIVSDSAQPFFVHGISGSGKTALLAEAWQRTESLEGYSLARFISATPKSGNLKNLLTDLCQQLELYFAALQQEIKPEVTSIDEMNLNSLNRYFESLLQQNPAGNRLIIFIDALDQLNSATGPGIEQTLSWLPRELPAGVRVIISALHRPIESPEVASQLTQHPGKASEYAKKHYPDSIHLNLSALTQDNACELLRSWLSSEGRRLTAVQESAILSAFKTQGLPLWLRLTIDIVKRWNSFTSIPQHLPGDIHELISMRMNQLRQEKYHGRLLVDKTLGYLHAAVNGLSTTELLDVLAQDEEYWGLFTKKSHHEHKKRQIPLVLWARLHADIDTYLTERKADGSILHTIYHRIIAEWVSDHISTSNYHYELSRYFSDQTLYLDSETTGTDAIPNLRKLNELIPQQIKAQAWNDLTGDTQKPSPLTDLSFTKAKCEAGLGYELSIDYDAAYAALPELAEEQCQEDLTRQKCRAYGEDIAEFSRQILAGDDSVLPIAPPSSKVTSRLQSENSVQEVSTSVEPTRAKRLQYFGSFFSANQHILIADPALTFFQAYNQATDGVVSEQATSLLNRYSNLWIARTIRPEVPPVRPIGHTLLEGHKKGANTLVLSADGTRALSGSSDNTVKLWDTQSGACLATLEGHSKAINAVSFSADGARALSGSWDQTLRLWDVNSGSCIETLEVKSSTVMLSAGGTLALSAINTTLQLWDIESRDCIASFDGHTNRIKAVALSTDNTRALSGSSDSTVRLWDTATGRCIRTFEEHSSEVTSVAFSADGCQVLSGSRDKTLRYWDVESGRCLVVMEGHSEAILTVALSADGMCAISGSEDKTLRIWNTETGDCIAILNGHADYVIASSMNVNGYLAISAGSYGDRTLRLWELEKEIPRVALEGHAEKIQKISFSPDFKRAVSASWDGSLKIWDTKTGHCLTTLEGHTDTVWTAQFSPDSSRVVSASWDDTVRLWDAETGNLLTLFEGHENKSWDVAFSRDGKRVISSGGDKALRIWNTEANTSVVLNGHDEDVTRLEISSDGTRILSGSIDNTIRVWSIESDGCLAVLTGHTKVIEDIAWSPDCRLVVSGSADKTLRVWDVENGECQAVLQGHSSRIKVVTWSSDGQRILSGAGVGDHTLRLWDPESGNSLSTLKGHTNVVSDAALNADGSYVCSGSLDSTLRLWDAKEGTCLAKYHAGAPINSLDINFEDGTIICACSDGQVHFLRINNVGEGISAIIAET